MQFDYQNWLSEADTFKRAFANPDLGTTALGLCVRGICFVTAKSIEADPEHTTEVMEGFHECLDIAKTRMGVNWFIDNLEVVATHSNADMPT